jgi:hypothetical protein
VLADTGAPSGDGDGQAAGSKGLVGA